MRLKSFFSQRSDIIALLAIIIISLSLSTWLMCQTFGYDSDTHFFKIDQKLWSDFGAAIPLIRSFSKGDNWPPQYPGFPGEPIRYHFGFYFLVGMLEKAGLRIDWALNIPSIIGFAGLMILIYLTGRFVFKSIWVGVLSVLFFLFDGTLAFIKYFALHPITPNTPMELYTNHRFPVFGPWDGNPISAFWTLNIYTNQRHLAFSYALTLGLIYILLQSKLFQTSKHKIIMIVVITIIMSSLLVTNQAAALIAVIFAIWFYFVLPYSRISLLFAALLCAPWFYYLEQITTPFTNVQYHPGYLIVDPITVGNFVNFWWQNLGLHSVLIILGMLISHKRIKLLFIIPLLILFIGPNLYQFSPDMINNHKFFNFFLIVASLFSAYSIVTLFRIIRSIRFIRSIIKIPFYLIPITFIFFLIFSGIINFLAIYNREPGGLADVEANQTATWIANNTPPDAIFLNSFWFYNPANLAGRYVFSGYAYFTWSYGYDKDAREKIVSTIMNSANPVLTCKLLRTNNITYIDLTDKPEYFKINPYLWNTIFTPVFHNPVTTERIYDVHKMCLPYLPSSEQL